MFVVYLSPNSLLKSNQILYNVFVLVQARGVFLIDSNKFENIKQERFATCFQTSECVAERNIIRPTNK